MSHHDIHQLGRERQQMLLHASIACHEIERAKAARRRARRRAGAPTGPGFDDAA